MRPIVILTLEWGSLLGLVIGIGLNVMNLARVYGDLRRVAPGGDEAALILARGHIRRKVVVLLTQGVLFLFMSALVFRFRLGLWGLILVFALIWALVYYCWRDNRDQRRLDDEMWSRLAKGE